MQARGGQIESLLRCGAPKCVSQSDLYYDWSPGHHSTVILCSMNYGFSHGARQKLLGKY